MMLPTVEIHLSISPEPYFYTMLHYFLASFRRNAWECAASTRFVVTVGSAEPPIDMDAAVPWAREHPVSWRWIDPALFRKYAWHAQAVDIFRADFQSEIAARMDPDILIGGPLDALFRRVKETGRFTGLIAHVSPFAGKSDRPNRESWEAVYREAGLPVPAFDFEHSMWPRMYADPDYRFCPPYFNGGALFAPSAQMAAIGSSIYREMDSVDRLWDTFYKGQLAISLAIERHKIPCASMDWKYNFPCTKPVDVLGPVAPDALADMRVWHFMGDGVISKKEDFADPAAVERLLARADQTEAMAAFQRKLRLVHEDVIREEHAARPRFPAAVAELGDSPKPDTDEGAFAPVFLVGVMRSGTTLLAKLLDRFPGVVYCPFELKQIWSEAGHVPMASPRTSDMTCPPAGAKDALPGQAESLRRAFLAEMGKRAAEKPDGGIFLNKNPHLCNKLDLASALFPQAKFIWIHRPLPQVAASQARLFARVQADQGTWEYWPQPRADGRARCWDVVRQPAPPSGWERDRVFPGGDIRWICEYWLESNRAVSGFLRPLPAHRWLEIAEHDLLDDPERELARCLGFLGLPLAFSFAASKEIDRTKTSEWPQLLAPEETERVRAFLRDHAAEVRDVFARKEYSEMDEPNVAGAASIAGPVSVCVAGMHRSGTSMVARLLNCCGIELGPEADIAPASLDNAEGFWENRRFVEINDEILNSLGGGWDLVPEFPAGWESGVVLTDAASRARRLTASFAGTPVWGWKDPRSTILIPFWSRIVIGMKVLVCLRNPLDVARSLQARNNFSLAAGFRLWQSYMERLAADTAPNGRIVTAYEAYFREPERELRRVLARLGQTASDDTIRAACTGIKREARHSASGLDDLAAAGAPQSVIALYRDLLAEAEIRQGVGVPDNTLCNICGSVAGFDLTNPDNPRESWVCRGCGCTSRDRMYILSLSRALGRTNPLADWPADHSVKILESAGARAHPRFLAEKFTYWNTAFNAEALARPEVDKTRYADLQALHYPDDSFTVVMNSDVFEHVRLHRQALKEIFRVLKPGGTLLLQAPFNPDVPASIIRVQPEGDQDIHLMPPMYHAEDTLVYRLYGADLLDDIRAAGLAPELLRGEFPENCITAQSMIIACKPVAHAAGLQEPDEPQLEAVAFQITSRLGGARIVQAEEVRIAAENLQRRLTGADLLKEFLRADPPVEEVELALLEINAEQAEADGRTHIGTAFRQVLRMMKEMRGAQKPGEEAAAPAEKTWQQMVKDADRATDEGRMEDAIELLATCAARYPEEPEVPALLATVLTFQLRHREAADALRRAIALSPDDARLYNMLGTLMVLLDNPQAASAAYVRALQLDPEFAEAKKNLDVMDARLNQAASETRDVQHAKQADSSAAEYPDGQCPCCAGRKISLFQDVQGYRYYACESCESLFIDPEYLNRVERGENLVQYEQAYWDFQMPLSRDRAFGIALARMAEVIHYARIPVRKFLDIAGGPGYFLDAVAVHLPSHTEAFHSTDKFPPPEQYRTKQPNYFVGDLGGLHETFDAGICIEVAEHLTPHMLRDLLAKLARISRPQAAYLFNTGMPRHVRYEMPGYLEPLRNGHIMSYSLQAVALLAEPLGFRAYPLAGKTWAFVLEYQSAGKPGENLKDRIWTAPKENMALLEDPQTGSVIRILGLESARAYG